MAGIFSKWFGKKEENIEELDLTVSEEEIRKELEKELGEELIIEEKEDVAIEEDNPSIKESTEAVLVEAEEDTEIEELVALEEPGIETIVAIEESIEEVEIVETPVIEKGFFNKLKEGLFKTRKNISEKINVALSTFTVIDEDLFEELEEILIMADVGVETTTKIISNLRNEVKLARTTDPQDVKAILKKEIAAILGQDEYKLGMYSPEIILVIGVNGVGKTTSIGKIASRLKQNNKKVIIAAADTFRAAAVEQIEIWAKRTGVDIVKHADGGDPAAVIFDAINSAKSKKADVVICDTAGRLHNKKNLMDELNKIFRIVDREYAEAHKEVWLVLDATTGQNAISQAKLFKEAANITGIILTKLDGTAKGGIVIAIKSELDIPVKLIGIGEQMNDLQDFNAEDFVEALFS